MIDSGKEQLLEARQEIDKIDIEIWALLEKRFSITKELAKIKNKFQLPVLDQNREKDILAKIETLNCENEVRSYLGAIYKLLFELSKKCQGE
jgi:chorismate mutase